MSEQKEQKKTETAQKETEKKQSGADATALEDKETPVLKRRLIDLPEIELHELADYENAFSSRAFKAGFRFD